MSVCPACENITSENLYPFDPLLMRGFYQVKKVVSYAESSEDEEPFNHGNSTQRARRRGGARPVVKDEDEYDEPDAKFLDDDLGTYDVDRAHVST